MTTEQYLNQINRLNAEIHNKLSEIYQLRELAVSISVVVNDDRVQTSSGGDKMANTLTKIVDMENETSALVDVLLEKRSKIIFQIDGIEDELNYRVLFLRYVEGRGNTDIADEIGYTPRQIIRIFYKALAEFEEKYGKEYENQENMSPNVT
jgi:DNA-directed RNA polymerase specialized sigma subunit